jgi:hypothetical protein
MSDPAAPHRPRFQRPASPYRRRRSAVPSDGHTSDRASPPHLQLDPSARSNGWIRRLRSKVSVVGWVLWPASTADFFGWVFWPRSTVALLLRGVVAPSAEFWTAPLYRLVLCEVRELHFRLLSVASFGYSSDQLDRSAGAFGGIIRPHCPAATRSAGLSAMRFQFGQDRRRGVRERDPILIDEPDRPACLRAGAVSPAGNGKSVQQYASWWLRRFGRCRPGASWSRRLAIAAPSGRLGRPRRVRRCAAGSVRSAAWLPGGRGNRAFVDRPAVRRRGRGGGRTVTSGRTATGDKPCPAGRRPPRAWPAALPRRNRGFPAGVEGRVWGTGETWPTDADRGTER